MNHVSWRFDSLFSKVKQSLGFSFLSIMPSSPMTHALIIHHPGSLEKCFLFLIHIWYSNTYWLGHSACFFLISNLKKIQKKKIHPVKLCEADSVGCHTYLKLYDQEQWCYFVPSSVFMCVCLFACVCLCGGGCVCLSGWDIGSLQSLPRVNERSILSVCFVLFQEGDNLRWIALTRL